MSGWFAGSSRRASSAIVPGSGDGRGGAPLASPREVTSTIMGSPKDSDVAWIRSARPRSRSRLLSAVLGAALVLSSAACSSDDTTSRQEPTYKPNPPGTGRDESDQPPPSTVAPVDPATLECPVTDAEARDALTRAVAVLQKFEVPRVDTVWALQVAAERHPGLGVRDPLGGRPLSEPGDPARRLIDPDAPPGRLPRTGDSPADRFVRDMSSVFLPPGPRATAEIDRVTALPGLDAYALTHQWLQLIWADELDMALPDDIRSRADELEARVRSEVGDDGETLDLWAERVGLLAVFGSGPASAAERAAWLCRAVRTQTDQGLWEPDGVYEQRYAGGIDLQSPGPEHLTAVMTLVLAGLVEPA